mgnify:CR=1 FL=1
MKKGRVMWRKIVRYLHLRSLKPPLHQPGHHAPDARPIAVDVRLGRMIGPCECIVVLAQRCELLVGGGIGTVLSRNLKPPDRATESAVEDRLGKHYYVAGLCF